MTLFLTSCSQNKSDVNREKVLNNYVSENFHKYSHCYDEISNRLEEKIKVRQKVAQVQIRNTSYKIDSLIVFNAKGNKLFTSINTKRYLKYASSDWIQGLYGVKIEGAWHIYFGGNLVALRQPYKYDLKTPFTWEELSFVAHEHFQMRYIDFDRHGNIIIDQEKIDKTIYPFNIGGTRIKIEGTEEDQFKALTNYYNSIIIDSTELQRMIDSRNEPPLFQLPKPKIKPLSWWDKLWNEEPIFESKEWKSYIRERNGKQDD